MKTVVAMRESIAPETLFAAAADAPVAAPAARREPAADMRTAFVPVLLGLLAVTAWLGHQAWLLAQDRQQLQLAQAVMQPTVEKSAQLRRSLDLLASDTQRLADAGNGNARVLVDELRKRGITINPGSAAVEGPAASAAGR